MRSYAYLAAILAGGFLFSGPQALAQEAEVSPNPKPPATSTPEAGSTELPELLVDTTAEKKKAVAKKKKPAASSSTAAAPAPAAGTAAAAPPSSGESAYGPVNGYVATRSATATKTDTPLIETPQSISVITADQVRDQSAKTLADTMSYTAGVLSDFAITPVENVRIRGFDANAGYGSYYRDGMRYGAAYYNGRQEPYGLERVEVLKGPASVLYGASAPGGLINSVSKLPTIEDQHEVNVSYGTNNRKEVSTDHGGRLTEDGSLTYRFTALLRDSDTDIDFGQDDRFYIAPAVTWRDDRTTLTILGNYQRDDLSSFISWPKTGTLLPNPNGTISPESFLGDPNINSYDTDTWTTGALLEHRFTDKVKFRQSVRYYDNNLDTEYVQVGDVAADNETLNRRTRALHEDTSLFTSDSNLLFKFNAGLIEHVLLTGVDYVWIDRTRNTDAGTIGSIDAFDPTYGLPYTLPHNRYDVQRMNQLGVYVQDQMKIADRLVLSAAGRWDRAEDDTTVTSAAGATLVDRVQKDSAFTYRIGSVFLADYGFAPFVSHSTSFQPNSGSDAAGNPFDPSEGTQYEGGIRYQPEGSNISITGTYFHIAQTNVLTADLANPGSQIATGEVTSKGFEFEAKAAVTRDLNLVAAYTYTDARVTESTTVSTDGYLEVGSRFYTPYHVASLWADYWLSDFGLDGLRVGAGVRYASDVPARYDYPDGSTPGRTLFDAAMTYEEDDWIFSIKGRNLTDETYFVTNCATTCFYGPGRSIISTVTRRW